MVSFSKASIYSRNVPAWTSYEARCWEFSPTANLCYGVFSTISSGAIRCSFHTRFRTRFRRVLAQIPREVPKGSGADTSWGSGGFRWRYLLRLRRVLCGSGGLRCRHLVRFRRVPVQIPCEVLGVFRRRFSVTFRRVTVRILGQVLESFGAGTWWGSGATWWGAWWGSRRFRGKYLVRFRKVPVQRPCEVPESFGGEDAWWSSGGFRCRYFVRFRRVLVQMLCEIPKGSGDFYGISHEHLIFMAWANNFYGISTFYGKELSSCWRWHLSLFFMPHVVVVAWNYYLSRLVVSRVCWCFTC